MVHVIYDVCLCGTPILVSFRPPKLLSKSVRCSCGRAGYAEIYRDEQSEEYSARFRHYSSSRDASLETIIIFGDVERQILWAQDLLSR